MARRGSLFDRLPDFGRVTWVTLILLVGISLADVIIGPRWLRIGEPAEWLVLIPAEVLRGQAWRLVTYPWVNGLLGLVIGVWMIVVFMAQLERMWGERRMLLRLLAFIVVPAAIVTLLSIPIRPLRGAAFVGIDPVLYCLIAAFACELRGAEIMLFPFPFRVSGDGLLLFEGGLLVAMILFTGDFLGATLSIVSLAFAIAWFRFNLVRDVRRSWLRFRKRRLEARMTKLRRSRGLHVVSSDDDDDGEPRRFLH